MGELIMPQSKKRKIVLIFTDLDGTLGNEGISSKSAETIDNFLFDDMERDVMIASARSPLSIKSALKKAELEDFLGGSIHITSFNGGLVYHGEHKIIDQPILRETATSLLRTCQENKLNAVFLSGKDMRAIRNSPWIEWYSEVIGCPIGIGVLPEDEKYYMVEFPKHPDEDLRLFKQRTGIDLFEKNKSITSICYHKEPFKKQSPQPVHLIQVSPAGVDKSNAFIKYMKRRSYLKMSQALVIGDALNDKKSLEISGVVSVAMGNATEEVKQAAKYVTKTVEQEGFSYAVKNLVRH